MIKNAQDNFLLEKKRSSFVEVNKTNSRILKVIWNKPTKWILFVVNHLIWKDKHCSRSLWKYLFIHQNHYTRNNLCELYKGNSGWIDRAISSRLSESSDKGQFDNRLIKKDFYINELSFSLSITQNIQTWITCWKESF